MLRTSLECSRLSEATYERRNLHRAGNVERQAQAARVNNTAPIDFVEVSRELADRVGFAWEESEHLRRAIRKMVEKASKSGDTQIVAIGRRALGMSK